MSKAKRLSYLGLGLAALVFMVLVVPHRTRDAKSCFRTAEDARKYILTRLEAHGGGGNRDPYTNTLVRSYTTKDGTTSHHFLVDKPARELELAEGFFAHGFAREALAHYENLIAYYPETPEGKRALKRIVECRAATVLGLVAPFSVVLKDGAGNLFVPALATRPPASSPGRIQDAFLKPAPPESAIHVVGYIDDRGGIVLGDLVPREFDFLGVGVVETGRFYYRMPEGAETLFEAECIEKARHLKIWRPAPASRTSDRDRIAEDFLYLGMHEGDRENPFEEGILEVIAADPDSPLRLDAQWLLKLRDLPVFSIKTKSCVTTGPELPLEVDARNVDRIAFRFARLEGPVPKTEEEVKEWLRTAEAKPSHEVTLPVMDGKSTLRLPVREPGAFRVIAEVRGRLCAFIAVRVDASLEVFAMPRERMLLASAGGFSVSSRGKMLGTTDAEGFLPTTGRFSGYLCEEHRQCCSGCDSCLHHHTDKDKVSLSSDTRVFVSGNGQFFRARTKFDPAEVAKVRVPPAAPILLIYTDRPAYKAGDTLRFRGILRIPRKPLKRTDGFRLDPAPGREVTVSIRREGTMLLQRAYVTGDFGTFDGEFALPLASRRDEHEIVVEHEGAKVAQLFEVIDYRKSDYMITLEPERGGFRVDGGYVWGAPVPGTTLRCAVNGREVKPEKGFLPVKEGQHVMVALVRGDKELAVKSAVFRLRPELEVGGQKEEGGAPSEAAAGGTSPESGAKQETSVFSVKPGRAVYGPGETIEIRVEAPWSEGEAIVILGDVQLYDLARVTLREGRAVACFPARAIHDPGVAAFAVSIGKIARADVRVRAALMKVGIDAPAKALPGGEVEVTLNAAPEAAFSLAAVDEAIYMIREDDTPAIYGHFYTKRPAALEYARFGNFEFDGEQHLVDGPPKDSLVKEAEWISGRPFRGKGTYDVIGAGGGGGGRFGSRIGGRRNLIASAGGGSAATEDSVLRSLRTLASLQRDDGSWETSLATEVGTISKVGATGLSLLSFLGAGYSHMSKDTYDNICFGDVVRNGLQWLMSQQDPEGFIGSNEGDAILNHALAALALSEAYGITGSALFKESAQRGIDRLCALQSSGGGWHRRDRESGGEILASVFGVMALKSAQLSDLLFPSSRAAAAWRYVDRAMATSNSHATTGGMMLAYLFLRRDKTDLRLTAAVDRLLMEMPTWNRPDFLGWYLAHLALFQYDGPYGPSWRRYFGPLKKVLADNERAGGGWTVKGETVCHTALGAMAQEVYYRYANAFGGGGEDDPLAPAPRVRIYFPDTAFWEPELVTGADGKVRASFRLPETITTTRLTARGVTRTGGVGETTARIETEQPFFVKLRSPQFLVLGDEVEVRAEVFNYTGTELETTVRLDGAPAVKTVRVPADRPASVAWRVRADDPKGLRLTVHAKAGEHDDAMERTVPVHLPGRERLASLRGTSRTGGSFSFNAPPGARGAVVKVHPKKANLAKLLDALRYLNDYPYG